MEGKTWQKRWTDRKSQSVLLNKNEACVHSRLLVHLKIVKASFPGWDADWLSCNTCKSRQHRSIADVHCAPYTGFLKCRISSVCPWLWFPCLGLVQQFQAFPHLDPLVWVQWWSKICCWSFHPPPQKNQILTLNLISAAKKTNCWSCVLRVHELSSNSTLDGLTRNKRLTWVTYCMRYLKTHKQTEKLLMFKPYPSCLTYLCRPKVLGLHQHVRVTIQTFSGGCDALESHWSSLSPSHPHMKDSPREQMSILAASKEDI